MPAHSETTPPAAAERQRVQLPWRGQELGIEYQWVGSSEPDAPVMIFLHEGLGSVAMWKDFPARVCAAVGLRGLVYSRPGYGNSTPRADEDWQLDYMHHQAYEVLPALREALGLTQPVWLLGHSDGGSIALLHAARFPEATAGAVLLAPHIMVEELSVRSIAQAREAFASTPLRGKLGRYHADVDAVFGRWARMWLRPDFLGWDIRAETALLRVPTLAIQGLDDQYGTLEQIRGIARVASDVKLLELNACGHSAHIDQPAQVIEAIQEFIPTRRQQ